MRNVILGSAVVLAAASCGVSTGSAFEEETATTQAGLTFEQFTSEYAFKEPETGAWIADGDTPFFSLKQLREFYEMNVRSGQLIVNRVGTADDRWTDSQKLNLTYCVSSGFGNNKAAMVTAMQQATQAWANAANIKYVYVPAQDSNCNASNNNVLFNVRNVNVGGQYLARAFFPSSSRADREVLVDNTSFGSDVSLVGVMRHELGHTLGFRHEHTRPEAGTCFEDNSWRVLTAYDAASVMHYPQCNGTGSFDDLSLTQLDASGAAILYGAPGSGGGGGTGGGSGGGGGTGGGSGGGGGTGGGSGGGGGTGGGSGGGGGTSGETVETFPAQAIASGATKGFGSFSVKPGTTFKAVISGTGDADLYVKFGSAPTASSYDCRPYLDSSAEECTLTVPSGASAAFVSVVGYTSANFALTVTYTKGAGTPPPGNGTPQTSTTTGTLTLNQQQAFPAFSVVGGTQFSVVMTGTGDADLYVRFGSAPTLTAFDCRPYKNGSAETCTVTVPASTTKVYVMVHGFTASTFSAKTSWTAPQ